MKHILVPTDFSSNANNALNYALNLAKRFNTKVVIFNAYQLPYNRADMMVSVMDILKADAEAGLDETLKNIKSNPEFVALDCSTIARVGDVVSVTTDLVEEFEEAMVVMGTKGESGVLEKLIGSNTASVIKNISCPVFAIPANAKYASPGKIALAYDMQEIENPKDMRLLSLICQQYNAQLQVYTVIPEADDKAVKVSELNLKTQKFFEGIRTESYFAVNGDIIEGIQELVDNQNPDWLAMIAKKYKLFESIFHTSMTKSMVIQTDKPLLILHNYN